MKNRIFYFALIILLLPCENYCNDFFYLNVGDTIVPYDKGSYKLRVYFFVKPETCSCINLLSTLDTVNNNPDIETLCFLSGTNDKLSKSFKEKYKIGFDVISDKINSYHEFYKVKRINVVFICDSEGKILYLGDLDNNSIAKISDYISQLDKIPSNENNPQFELLSTSIVDYVDMPFFLNMEYLNFFKTPINQKEFVFIKNDEIFSVNKSGKITATFNLGNTAEETYYYSLTSSNCCSDSMIFINAYAYTYDKYIIKRKLIYFDIDKQQINKSMIYKNEEDSIIIKSNLIFPLYGNNRLLCSEDLFFFNVNDSTKPLAIIDTSNISKRKKVFGFVDKIFTIPEKKRDYGIYYSTDENYHYIINQYSDIIQKYDNDFNKIAYEKLDFKNIIKIDINKFNAGNDVFVESNKYSFIKGNFYNKEKRLILIVYENRLVPEGIRDIFSPKSHLNFYGHIVDEDFKPYLNYDIAFPERNIPFHFEDDIVYCYQILDNKLMIKKYRIKNLNIITGR